MEDARPTDRLGSFLSRVDRAEIPGQVYEKAAICLVDAIGLALIARDEPTFLAARALASPAHEMAARIWSDGARVSVSDAVLVNAIAVHAHFHDDSDNASWSHPGSFVVPAAVSAGEAAGCDLETVLRALVAGYSAVEWLGAKERVAEALIRRGIRTSPTLGTVAAAAAVAVILRLDAAAATSAIGIASSITGGLLEPVGSGSDEWRVQNGNAARSGLLAAQLAARGVVGAPRGLEGPKGLARSYAGLAEIPPEWNTDPRLDAILDACAKPYATLGDNMAVVLAAQLIRESGVDHRRVARVVVHLWRPYADYPGTSFQGPFERVAQALASTAFAVSAMLVYGELEYDISRDRRADEFILRIVPTIEIVPTDDAGPYDGAVEVTLEDGSMIRRETRDAPRTLLFPDRARITGLTKERAVRSGHRPGAGQALAQEVFGFVDRREKVPFATVLDHLAGGNLS